MLMPKRVWTETLKRQETKNFNFMENNNMENTLSLPLSARISEFLRQRPVIIQLLRFAAIGSINTALDFIILNFITKSFNITSGLELGMLNAVSFVIAVIQSYLWNRAWTFTENSGVSFFQNALRLILVGGLGFGAFLAVFIGAAYGATSAFFLIVLFGFFVAELILWAAFHLQFGQREGAGHQFTGFIVVSLVGLLINSFIIVIATNLISPSLQGTVNADTIKNVAKIMATGVSLVWNFIGYKLIVFKK